MAEASPKGGDLWEKASFPEGVEKSSWNFNIYVMYAVIKHIVRGSFKGSLDTVMQNSSQCQTNMILGDANYLDLDGCFLTNQKYSEPLQVGSVSEDVPIVQIFRQACEDTPEDGNMKNLQADLSFECDFNLCFKDISASENPNEVDAFRSDHAPLEFQVIPSSVPGQATLAIPPNIDYSAVPGLRKLCVPAEQGVTLVSSELLVDELYSLLTITTAIMNVQKCQNVSNSEERDENESVYATSLQYVGQAGPAVHIVTCIVPGETNRKHLFLTEDVSISVPCKTWPSCAREWFHRARPSGWPSKELIDQVLQGGCHLVPKYDPGTGKGLTKSEGAAANGDPTPKTQWRYSFSLAEKTLMNSITDDQRMCYIIFKYLFARFVKLESIITTYSAKTLFLWELETVPPDQWGFSKIGDRVKSLVGKLRSCVKNKYCQHYFINGCNTLQQMDDKSCKVTLENGFIMLDEEMAEGPDLETGVFETTADFPFHFMTTYKSFYPINVWLESLSAQMKGKMDPPSKAPSEQNIQDFLDNSKVHPFEMPEILIHLALADKVYGQPLAVPQSLLQEEKVARLVQFLKGSATPEKFEECMKDLDVELKFLHLQYKVIDEIEQFLRDNPAFVYSFDDSSDDNELNEEDRGGGQQH